MLRPFHFGWRKILPILYSDYLSETEILNMIICRFNDFVEEINKIEENIDHNRDDINDIMKDLEEMKKLVKDAVSRLEELEKDNKEFKDELLAIIDELRDDMDGFYEDILDKVDDKVSSTLKRVEELIRTLELRIDVKLADLRLEMIDLKKDFIKSLANQWIATINYVNRKISEISANNLMVFNPYNGKKQSLQDYINYHAEQSGRGLTAEEYRLLYLTALEYRELNLTAYEYRMYGIQNADVRSEALRDKYLQYDMFGRRRENPVSSVFTALDCAYDATMSGFDLTAEEYRAYSDRYGAYNLDRYGLFILSNNMESLHKVTVSLVGDTWVQEGDGEMGEVTTLLHMKKSYEGLDQIDILTDRSIDELVLDMSVELVPPTIEGYSFTGVYDRHGFQVINKRYELVDGGIALNATFLNNTYAIYERDEEDDNILNDNYRETKTVLVPAVIDFNAITTL